ncbi:MAG: type III-B CRISPR module RAMP protein Cmr4 [Atopobiaceae bacterium]
MDNKFYYLSCLTNLHVGNGADNFGIIDREVERDFVTGYPTIPSSGLKGAFRKYFTEAGGAELVDRLFGPSSGSGDTRPGSVKFISGQLLFRPVRASKGAYACYQCTTMTTLRMLARARGEIANDASMQGLLADSGPEPKTCYFGEGDGGVEVEGFAAPCADAHEELGKCAKGLLSAAAPDAASRKLTSGVVLLGEDDNRAIPLPVIARNQLDNGISKNLWYEEFVPHDSIFWFAVLGPEEDLEAFDNVVAGKVVQIGGNATIGRGLCLVVPFGQSI